MTVLRVLHVSDLHARQGLRTDQREIAEAMVRDAARLRDERPFDLAVVTGDLAFAGKTSEFALAREILLGPLETELDLGPDRVVIAPGNHDVDRKLISDEARLRGRLVDRASVNELLDDEAQRAAACARLEAWESFCRVYYEAEAPKPVPPLGWVHRLEVRKLRVGVAALNSAWRSSGDDDHGHLLLGDRQVKLTLDAIEPCDVRLVAVHHPLEWLARFDASGARVLFEKHAAIVLTGHEHRTDPAGVVSSRGQAIYDRAGCLYETHEYSNSYSVLDIDGEADRVELRLRTWWADRREFDAATNIVKEGRVSIPFPRTGTPAPTDSPKAGAVARLDNLPTELTTFIGREAELDEAARLLGRGRLLTLIGPAGCGKTRLAVETAARQRDRFRDGVWLVELAPLSQPDLVADAVAAAVGVKLGRRSPATEALVESLTGREALIVLDNCEHLVAACARVAEALLRGCPELQVLATSREALRVSGEIVLRVPSLSLPDLAGASPPEELLRSESVRLFVDRAAAVQPGFELTAGNGAEVARICHRLDGVPLAIELAAARVGTLPPAEIARRLGESFRLLRQGRRTAETRQQTLEGALDWSYRLLDGEEAVLLRHLAVFAGGFALDAVEDVCEGGALSRVDVVDVLMRLVGKSLIVAAEELSGRPRYRLLEMVRQYARERLAEAAETDALLERHARWYVELAEEGAAPEPADVRLRRFDLETDNFRAALHWLLDHDPPEALRLAGSLSDWWLLRGRLGEAREWLEAAVERTPDDSGAAAAALLRAMWFADRTGDTVQGGRLAERSLSIYRKLGDRAGTAQALHMLGLQSWLRGDYPRASELLEAAIEEARLAPSPAHEANATHALGILAISTRDLPGARSRLEQALELLERLPDDSPPVFLVVTPGQVPLVRARGPVLGVVQEEFMFGRVVGPPTAAAYVRINLALVARLEGDPGGADVLLGNALARLRAADDERGIAQALAAVGRLATLEGDTARAHETLRESLVIRRRFGDVRSVGLTLGLLAELAVDGGDLEHGGSLLERALAMFHEVGDRPAALWMLWALARVELLAGKTDAARRRLEAGLAVCEALRVRVMRAWTLAALAEVDLRAAVPDRAQGLLEEARQEFDQCGDPWGLERCEALERELRP